LGCRGKQAAAPSPHEARRRLFHRGFAVIDRQLSVPTENGDLVQFDPKKTKRYIAKADALIDYAIEMKDWPLLEQAIDFRIDQQRTFVGFWDAGPGKRHGPGGSSSEDKAKNADRRSLLSVAEVEKQTGIKQQQVSKWRRRLAHPDKYREMLYASAYSKAMAETVTTIAAQWTGDPESYTPKRYVEAAREAMGAIDLDPASNEMAQQVVRATIFYDEEDNGLVQDWRGRIFLNPPYKHPLVTQFIDKLCDEYETGHVSAAVLLTNNATDTRWFHRAAKLAAAVCFTAGRINFYKPDGKTLTQPTNGQAFFYFCADRSAFVHAFSEIGLSMARVA